MIGMEQQRNILVESFLDWREHKVPRMAAAVSFYAIFCLAPLLIMVTAIASLILGHKLAQGQLVFQLQEYLGYYGARFFVRMLQPSGHSGSVTIIGFLALLWGSTAMFAEMQASLNAIWGVRPKAGNFVKDLLRPRIFSFSLVATIGLLLFGFLLVSALIAAVGSGVTGWLPKTKAFFSLLNFVVSFAVVTVLFASIYKRLPDVVLEWRQVKVGAVFTAILFTLGKHLLGAHLGKSAISSTYGAAGSLVLVLLWVFYSSQVLFFGAAFTKSYALRKGYAIAPKPHAELDGHDKRATEILMPENGEGVNGR
jgi:membrane protein